MAETSGADVVRKSPWFSYEGKVLKGAKAPPPTKAMGDIILDVFKNKPHVVGQIEAATGRQSTFEEMRERSVKCALWLREKGIEQTDMVALCTDNHLDAYVPLLASFYVGAVCSTWDHVLTYETAHYFLSMVRPKIIFLHEYSVDNVVAAAKELNLEVTVIVFERVPGYRTLDDVLEGHGDEEVEKFECARIDDPRQTATIVCSSGSTGMPKGTELSYQGVGSLLIPQYTDDLVGVRVMWTPTLRWQYGMMMVMNFIQSESTRIIVPDNDDAEGMCKVIEKYKVTWFGTDPFILIRLVKYGILSKYKLPSLKTMGVSGAHLKARYIEEIKKIAPHIDVLQTYGMTDAGNAVTKQKPGCKPGSCGYVIRNTELCIQDLQTGEALGPNETGEICIKAPSVMTRYYNNPEATERAFDKDGWLHSGDVGYYDSDGELWLVDRISEFLIYQSINVSPAQIEMVLERHPAVYRAAVVGVPHEADGDLPMAFIFKVKGKEVTEEELINLVKESLPHYCWLHGGVKFLDEIPRTATGKVAKKQLRELLKKSMQK